MVEKQGSALRKLHQAEGPQQRHDGTLLTMFTDVWQLHKSSIINISETVLVPLYDTSMIQARRDISFSAWAQRRVEVGCSKYLGIIVGPQADADINFFGPMRKFRERAAYWLASRTIDWGFPGRCH